MSQANFMRNLRMNMPQYITNVTSFNDAVKILKNKAILTENMDPKEDEEELDAIIKKMEQGEEEEKGLKSGYGIYDPLEEDAEPFPRDPRKMAELVADVHGDELKNLEGKAREDAALSYAYEQILHSDHPKSKVIAQNLVWGYANEDWPMNYIDALDQILGQELNEGRKKKEAKKELHPNQIHPQELRMGIKVELEHTDDLDKAKKIALDHLAENPFYYTALKLSGIESPSAPKTKPPVEKKTKKRKEAVELVDKTNAMQKVKMPKAEVKKKLAEIRINTMPGEETNDTMKHAMQYIDSKIANPTLRALSNELELQPLRDNRAVLRFGYWEQLPDNAIEALEKQFDIEQDIDSDEEQSPQYVYVISSKKKPGGDLGSSLEKGASKAAQTDTFKEALESLVREVVSEYYDGRDNLDAENEY